MDRLDHGISGIFQEGLKAGVTPDRHSRPPASNPCQAMSNAPLWTSTQFHNWKTDCEKFVANHQAFEVQDVYTPRTGGVLRQSLQTSQLCVRAAQMPGDLHPCGFQPRYRRKVLMKAAAAEPAGLYRPADRGLRFWPTGAPLSHDREFPSPFSPRQFRATPRPLSPDFRCFSPGDGWSRRRRN